jgi:hypothetical protein
VVDGGLGGVGDDGEAWMWLSVGHGTLLGSKRLGRPIKTRPGPVRPRNPCPLSTPCLAPLPSTSRHIYTTPSSTQAPTMSLSVSLGLGMLSISSIESS